MTMIKCRPDSLNSYVKQSRSRNRGYVKCPWWLADCHSGVLNSGWSFYTISPKVCFGIDLKVVEASSKTFVAKLPCLLAWQIVCFSLILQDNMSTQEHFLFKIRVSITPISSTHNLYLFHQMKSHNDSSWVVLYKTYYFNEQCAY